MKRLKGCFNEKCVVYKNRNKPYGESDIFCSKCGSELEYVCKDKKCYDPLANVLKEYCEDCLAERNERTEKTKDQLANIAKGVPAVVVSIGGIVGTIVSLKKDVTKIIPKKK